MLAARFYTARACAPAGQKKAAVRRDAAVATASLSALAKARGRGPARRRAAHQYRHGLVSRHSLSRPSQDAPRRRGAVRRASILPAGYAPVVRFDYVECARALSVARRGTVLDCAAAAAGAAQVLPETVQFEPEGAAAPPLAAAKGARCGCARRPGPVSNVHARGGVVRARVR